MTTLALTSDAAELGAGLDAAASGVADLAATHRRAGEVALEAAEIPVRTGHLASTATVAVAAEGFALTATASYAGVVHARDPFFTEALQRRAEAVAGVYADHVDSTLSTTL